MGKRFAWLAFVLLFVTACGDGGITNPLDKIVGITNIDDACQALSADEVNDALGVSDIQLFGKEALVDSSQDFESENICAYVNKLPASVLETTTDMRGVVFSVGEFDDKQWNSDAFGGNDAWEKVDIGNEAFMATSAPIIVVHHGKWSIGATGTRPDAMSDEDFKPIMENLVKKFVSRLQG